MPSNIDLLGQLYKTLEQFEKDSGKTPDIAIVSAEIFAKIMPSLTNIKHDKNYSEGMLGSVVIKSDFLIQDDSMIVTRLTEWDDKFPMHEFIPFIPFIPAFEPLHQKKRKALKERAKDFLKRSRK